MAEVENPALGIVCPMCSAVESDDLEVVELHQFVRLRCGSCNGQFSAWLDECRVCGADISITFAASDSPVPAEITDLCATCLATETPHEADDLLSATLA